MESTSYSIAMHLVNIKSITETTVDNLYHPPLSYRLRLEAPSQVR